MKNQLRNLITRVNTSEKNRSVSLDQIASEDKLKVNKIDLERNNKRGGNYRSYKYNNNN